MFKVSIDCQVLHLRNISNSSFDPLAQCGRIIMPLYENMRSTGCIWQPSINEHERWWWWWWWWGWRPKERLQRVELWKTVAGRKFVFVKVTPQDLYFWCFFANCISTKQWVTELLYWSNKWCVSSLVRCLELSWSQDNKTKTVRPRH